MVSLVYQVVLYRDIKTVGNVLKLPANYFCFLVNKPERNLKGHSTFEHTKTPGFWILFHIRALKKVASEASLRILQIRLLQEYEYR